MKEKFTNSSILGGKFTSDHEFEAWSRISLRYEGSRPGKSNPLVYLKGELIPNGTKTEVMICIVPYPIWVVAICSIIAGILGYFQFIVSNNIVILIVSIFLAPIFPFLLLRFSISEKEELKRNFSESFGFQQVKAFENTRAN